MNSATSEKRIPTREQLDEQFARTTEHLVAEATERRRIAEWPGLVDKLLNQLMGRSIDDRASLSSIEARLTVLETAMGIGRD